MKKNVMADLETLDNNSRSAILSIGAVEFDETGIGRDFYCVVDAQSCIDAGLQIDVSTIMWWMQQSDQARKAFDTKEALRIEDALAKFSAWFPEGACVWGNGATFDNVILDNAYRAVGLDKPWKYNADRCYRTLKALYPSIKGPVNFGTAHNALDDARYQALHAVEILKAMKL